MNQRFSFHRQTSNRYAAFIFIFPLLLLPFLAGCGQTAASKEEDRFAAFTEECFKEYVSSDSISLHFKLSDPSAYGLTQGSASYGDISLKAQEERCDRAAELLNTLQSFQRDQLTEDQQLTYDIFERKLRETAESKEYALYQTLLGAGGLPSQIPVSLSEYYFNNEEDVRTYLALLGQIPDVFVQLVEYEKERTKAGFQVPSFMIDDTVEEIDQLLKGSEEDNLLINTFEERIQGLKDLSEDHKKTYISNNRALFKQVVLPAYESLRTTLTAMKSSDDGNTKERVCQYDKGKEYYRLLLKSSVGTDKTPEECIKALENLLKETIADISALNTSYPDLYTDYLSAQPKLTDPKDVLSNLEADILEDFPEIPEVSYTLKDLPASLSGTSASAFYLVPPIDSAETNIIYINQNRVDSRELLSTLAHEGYPGHLYQTNYYLSLNPDPLRCLLRTSGYDEGWGTYAQLYSYHYLEFEDLPEESLKPLQQLYQDNDLLALTLSSLSDLYVNYKNYDREALAKYLKPYGIQEEYVSSIYQYVTENPTTYLTYGMGYYELNHLKEACKKQEGEEFDIRTFHHRVLDCGSCPFALLQDYQ